MSREPIPPGTVSTIRGRYQAPVLAWLTRVLVVAGLATLVLDGSVRIAVATAAVAAVVAVPLLRVGWLVFRWTQEADRRFVSAGVLLLGIVAAGTVLAALGA